MKNCILEMLPDIFKLKENEPIRVLKYARSHCIGQLCIAVTECLRKKQKKGLFFLMVSEVSVRGKLRRLLLDLW